MYEWRFCLSEHKLGIRIRLELHVELEAVLGGDILRVTS